VPAEIAVVSQHPLAHLSLPPWHSYVQVSPMQRGVAPGTAVEVQEATQAAVAPPESVAPL